MPPWLFVLTLAADTAVAAPRSADPWLGPDKVKHAVVAFAVQGGSYAALRLATGHGGAVAGAVALTATVSLLKERHDRGRTGFSARDLVYDAAGILAATLLLTRVPHS